MSYTIDAHQHFWEFDPIRDSWIDESMECIQRDFLPQHIKPLLRANGVDGSVVIQNAQSESENLFQLNNAQQNDFIKGVVGWINLEARNIDEQLSYWSSFKKMKGFRHILQGEKDRAYMLREPFCNGIGLLEKYGFAYDLLILPDQLQFARKLVSLFPHQKFVINHIAKPYIKDRKVRGWKEDIQAMATLPNVFCKISGLVTEADWKQWKPEDFTPYIDIVVEAFGTKRIMYGSDWPVCLLPMKKRRR